MGSTEEEEEVEDGSLTAASLIATWRGAKSREGKIKGEKHILNNNTKLLGMKKEKKRNEERGAERAH